MNIGLALLYTAFAVVALWLLGELLVQHRAPAHWRALALLGFLGLVAGVHQGSAVIVGAGVLAFGAGQGLVTRSVKRGEGPHWSLRGRDGALPGPLGRVPLLDRVFPAAERPEPDGADPVDRVGAIGSVEDAPEPVLAGPGAGPGLELVESQAAAGPAAGQSSSEPSYPEQGYAGQAYAGQAFSGQSQSPSQSQSPPPGAEQPGYGQQFPQQAGQPYPPEYQQPYPPQYEQPFGQPFAQPFPQAEGYPAAAYPQQYPQSHEQSHEQPQAQSLAQEYADEYARQYAEQHGQPPYQQQPEGYYAAPVPAPAAGYGYDPAAQPQPGYYQQQPPSPEEYDAVGYDPQGTYQYDYQAQAQAQYPQQVPPQPYQAEPEPWNYG